MLEQIAENITPWDSAILELGALALAIGAVVAVALAVVDRIIRTARRVRRFLDDWDGRPADDTHPRSLGVLERLDSLEGHAANNGDKIDAVDKELRRNGGVHVDEDGQLRGTVKDLQVEAYDLLRRIVEHGRAQ